MVPDANPTSSLSRPAAALPGALPPPRAAITCTRHARGITFTDQPRGLLGRDAPGIISFLLIIGIVSVMGIWRLVTATSDMQAYWPAVAIICIMLPLTGFAVILLLVDRINKGRLPTLLWTEDERLVLLRPGLRGMHRQEWLRSQVASVEVVPQATGANLKPLGCLRLQFGPENHVDVFEWHLLSEIEWVAQLLRPVLAEPVPEPKSNPSDDTRLGE
jgi:hypothetical protein